MTELQAPVLWLLLIVSKWYAIPFHPDEFPMYVDRMSMQSPILYFNSLSKRDAFKHFANRAETAQAAPVRAA